MSERRHLLCCIVVVGGLLASSAYAQSEPPTVVFLGPLSGAHQDIGQRAWRSAAMAMSDVPGVRLERVDTAAMSAPDAYAAALAEGAVAILGPIGDLESRALIEAADPTGPPIFLLSGSHGIERAGDHVFRLRTSIADQAEALAGAMIAQGTASTFAVLAPDDDYGDEATESFVRAVSAFGGTTVRVARYPAGTRDVGASVEHLVGERSLRLVAPADPWRTAPEASLRAGGGDRTRPDALYIADYADAVASVLPHLQFHRWLRNSERESVRLIGTSGWASRDLETVSDLAAGARVVQLFRDDDPRPSAEAFTLEYATRFREQPTEFDAQVFDAAGFVLEVVRSVGADVRPARIIDAAHAVPHRGGVCGSMWIGPSGGVVRQLGFWEIDGGGSMFPLGVIEPPRDGTGL